MPTQSRSDTSALMMPPLVAVPTEAEVRAIDLEREDAEARQTTSAEREARIRETAYAKSEQRGFAPGHELDDWLAAERDVDRAAGASTSAGP